MRVCLCLLRVEEKNATATSLQHWSLEELREGNQGAEEEDLQSTQATNLMRQTDKPSAEIQ